MSGGWAWAEAAAYLLERDEREAVLGDLAEAGESARQALLAVLGLILRREAALWKSWRPWLAAFGLALPCSFLLMGFSVSVSVASQRFLAANAGYDTSVHSSLLTLVLKLLLLTGCAFTGGFVVASMSRRTLWVSFASCFLPCLFCLERFRIESLSRLCLFLFLVPALWGVREALQRIRLPRGLALALAPGMTAMAIFHEHGSPVYLCALLWPVWYLAAKALVHEQKSTAMEVTAQ